MKRALAVWAGLLLVFSCAQFEKLCADTQFRSYAWTIAETEEIITDWLKQNQFHVYRLNLQDRQVHLTAEKTDSRLRIDLKPHSPLATQVRVQADRPDTAEGLDNFLTGYMHRPADRPATAHQPIPEAVRKQLEAVVCLYAGQDGEFQFSGFIVDPSGFIVCTAHDLNPHERIRVLLFDGRELEGRVVRIDIERDLALIKVEASFSTAVALQSGRYMLRPGDPLFAITCPNSHRPVVQRGRLDGPPRRVQGFPLWQVDMHIDRGSSGSPVFDVQGCLAAIVKGRFRGTDSIGFLIPFETLVHFLENK
jgi:serine protease Do